MIVVKVELHSAITKRVSLLGSAIIANEGSTGNNRRRGNYTVRVAHKNTAHDLQETWARPLRKGHVDNYPRLSYNVWRLVLRAIAAAFPEESVTLPDCDVPDMRS